MPTPAAHGYAPATSSPALESIQAIGAKLSARAGRPSTLARSLEDEFARPRPLTGPGVEDAAISALAGSSWAVRGRFHNSEPGAEEHEEFALRSGHAGVLVGDGIADGVDRFTIERVVLDRRATRSTLTFEQLYLDGTRMQWSCDLDEACERMENGFWTALSGAGVGSVIGSFVAERVADLPPQDELDAADELGAAAAAEEAAVEGGRGGGGRGGGPEEEEDEEDQSGQHEGAADRLEGDPGEQQEADEAFRARAQARRVAALRVEGHSSLGKEYEALLLRLLAEEGDDGHHKLRKAWVATSKRSGTATTVGQPDRVERFLREHADEPPDFWRLDEAARWFDEGRSSYMETDITRFDRGCFNGEYVPVQSDGAGDGTASALYWPHYLNPFGRFLYRTHTGRWNFSRDYASYGGGNKGQDALALPAVKGVASSREGHGEVPTGQSRWKTGRGQQAGVVLSIVEVAEPVRRVPRREESPPPTLRLQPELQPQPQPQPEPEPQPEDPSGYSPAATARAPAAATSALSRRSMAEARRASPDGASSPDVADSPSPTANWAAELKDEIARLKGVAQDNAVLLVRCQEAEAAEVAMCEEMAALREDLDAVVAEQVAAEARERESADAPALRAQVEQLQAQLSKTEEARVAGLAERDELLARMGAERAAERSDATLELAASQASAKAESAKLETAHSAAIAKSEQAEAEAARAEAARLEAIAAAEAARTEAARVEAAMSESARASKAVLAQAETAQADAQAARADADAKAQEAAQAALRSEELESAVASLASTNEQLSSEVRRLRQQAAESAAGRVALDQQMQTELERLRAIEREHARGQRSSAAESALREELRAAKVDASRLQALLVTSDGVGKERQTALLAAEARCAQHERDAASRDAEAAMQAQAVSAAMAEAEALGKKLRLAEARAASKGGSEDSAELSARVEAAVAAARKETAGEVESLRAEVKAMGLAMAEAHRVAELASTRLRESVAASAAQGQELERLRRAAVVRDESESAVRAFVAKDTAEAIREVEEQAWAAEVRTSLQSPPPSRDRRACIPLVWSFLGLCAC